MNDTKAKVLLTLDELTERWSVSRSTVYREIKRRRLRRILIGGSVRFRVKDVELYEGCTDGQR